MENNGNPPPIGNPPPYPGAGVGFEQHSMQSPVTGQTNYAFSSPQQPVYPPQPGHFIGQPQQHIMNNIVVAQVGGGNVYHEPAPVDYSTQAWIACLCCFWPTGVIAIMKATESREALARGDLLGARSAAAQARQMVRISYIVGIIGVVILVVIIVIVIVSGLSSSSSATCCVNGDCDYC